MCLISSCLVCPIKNSASRVHACIDSHPLQALSNDLPLFWPPAQYRILSQAAEDHSELTSTGGQTVSQKQIVSGWLVISYFLHKTSSNGRMHITWLSFSAPLYRLRQESEMSGVRKEEHIAMIAGHLHSCISTQVYPILFVHSKTFYCIIYCVLFYY